MSSAEAPRPTADEATLKAIVGSRIRQARLGKGMTGRRLAELAGVTPAYVSQVEHGQYMPSVATLMRLTEALGVAIGDVLETEAPVVGRPLTPEQWNIVRWPEAMFDDAIIAADARGELEVSWSRIQPGGGSGPDLLTHSAELQLIFVLKGKLEMRVGEERHTLREYWSISFPGTIRHGYFNPSSKPAEYLSIVTPAIGLSARENTGRPG